MNTREVLIALGFQEDWLAMTDELPGYVYDFGNLRLSATLVMSQFLQPKFMLGGTAHSDRAVGLVQFEMPLQLKSVEQGAAWIAHGVGDGFTPKFPNWWLPVGRAHSDTLPWAAELEAYERRPQCSVAREWFRTAARQLREHAALASDSDVAFFSFDGEVLKIRAGQVFAAMPATGEPWPAAYAVRARRMNLLPQRISRDPIHISVLEGRLTVFNRAFELEKVYPDEPKNLESGEFDQFDHTPTVESDDQDDDSDAEPAWFIDGSSVFPQNDLERKLCRFIDEDVVNSHEATYTYGVECCDLCGVDLIGCGLFVDGRLANDSAWAHMCPACFEANGWEIGWGKGQLYARQADQEWRLVSGFKP